MKALCKSNFIVLFGLVSSIAQSNPCQVSDTQIQTIRENVRAFLQQELGDRFVYYDGHGSISDEISTTNDECMIYVEPKASDSDNKMLLVGAAHAVFDCASLDVKELRKYGW